MKTVQPLINAAIICASFAIIKLTRCSNFFAELDVVGYCTDQRTLCQNTGSFIHIVCEYYGKVGSACSKFKDVPLDDNNEHTILRRINSMRSQAALGEALGKDEQKLPRAYGMKKVCWDGELAAFAKIMLNQCINKHRYSCAASNSFTNPIMVYMSANTTGSAEKIIDNILSSWEADALTTTTDEILHSPDLKGRGESEASMETRNFKDKDERGESRFYIKMLGSEVTHIGCATAVYEHEITPLAVKPSDNIRLSGHMICYLSDYSRLDTPVYNTTEPVQGTGWTKCGCPPMYRETKNCLCVYHKIVPKTKIQTNAAINMSTTTSSTTAYYDNIEKYMQQDYNMGQVDKNQLFDATTDLKLEMTKQPQPAETPHKRPEFRQQQKLEWASKESLATDMQKMLEPHIQQKLKETQSARQGTGTQGCTDRGRCDPKIIMLPILTIENAPKLFSHRKGREIGGFFRRSVRNSSVPTTKAIGDVSLTADNIDELYKNISIRSKVIESMREIRQKQADVFSKEKKELQLNIESSKDTEEPIESSVETTKQTLKPNNLVGPNDGTTKRAGDEPTEKPKSVVNFLELLEKQGKIVQVLSITEPSHPVTKKQPRDDDQEKAKRKVMRLLDLLQRKGSQALLSSREFVDFDVKMRNIYQSVIKTPRKGNLIMSWDTKPL